MEHHPRPQLDPLANIGGVLNQPGPGPVGPPGGTGPSIPQSVGPRGCRECQRSSEPAARPGQSVAGLPVQGFPPDVPAAAAHGQLQSYNGQ